ncbi:hypothetical protein BGZ76_002580 [Entomortierella beljakovae]|nr:hypothetical protein BGZ76_002580 [Entomortierella beljakovae]
MPSLEFSPKAQQGPTHHRNGSRDYSDVNYQPHHAQPNGPGPGAYPRIMPTPPKTPDSKMPLMFASGMSRSISLGSSDRHGMNAPGTGAPPQHQQFPPQNGPSRPNLPGIASIHKPQHPTANGSNNSGHYPYVASTMTAMVPPSSSTTTSLSSSTPPPIRMARSSSSMGVSSGGPVSPFNHPEAFSPQPQHHQSLNYALPRPNLSRHESTGSHSGRFIRGHEHHRSLDIDPFSALTELATLAEKHREVPGGRPGNSANTVVVQSKEDPEYHQHSRRGSVIDGGESMSRSGSNSSGHEFVDIEDAVIKTMIERPPIPGPLVMGRRFSTLGHVKEEEHGDDAEDTQAHHHSYHIDARNTASSPIGHSKSHSAHEYSRGDLSSTSYRSKRFSMDFSTTSDPPSDDDEDDMAVDEDHTYRGRTSPPSSTFPRPSASYMGMRRGSVRELMAIDNLCLSSEEVERC